jgi:hypothetical protein
VNAVLGLLVAGDINPARLAEAGFRLAGLEVPVVGPDGKVVVDVVLFHPDTRHFVLVEAKSGANIETAQGQRYAALDAQAVVLAAGVSVPHRGELSVEVAYACLAEHADRITLGLAEADLPFAVISVDKRRIDLLRPDQRATVLDAAWSDGAIELAGPIGRMIPFDHESPTSVFEAPVRAQLVAELSHTQSQVTVRLLTERVVSQFAIYAGPAQNKLVNKVREVVRSIVDTESDTYGYIPRSGTRTEDAIEFRRTPEDRDPRGRTRAYQALPGRRPRSSGPVEPHQPDLLDLLAEMTDENDGSNDDDETLETNAAHDDNGTEAQP